MITVCTFNARMLASEASIEDLMMQGRKIRRTPEKLHIGTNGLHWNEQRERLSEFIMRTKTINEERKPRNSRSPKPVINCDLFTSLADIWEDAVVDNIDEEYDRLVQHPRDSVKKAKGSRATKRRLSYETVELTRQRRAAKAAGNYQLTVRTRQTVQRSDKRSSQGLQSYEQTYYGPNVHIRNQLDKTHSMLSEFLGIVKFGGIRKCDYWRW
ncbi:hypothetical protein ANCCAN_28912 [Ancylostoma caninum]|uniref:Uncharacterized protein n=1 Tax=Ancylostoma caninum TaxID=29170 RepID=A0A368F5A4_ANCCA|nr:hypothetical protein ANCCAN_28912 [Ancylostoma caninum]